METCSECGREYDVSTARRCIGQLYGAGSYNVYVPEGDLCEECAMCLLGTYESAGAEVLELSGWEPD